MNDQTKEAYIRMLGTRQVPEAVAAAHEKYQFLWNKLHGSSKVLPATMLPNVVMAAGAAPEAVYRPKPVDTTADKGNGRKGGK